MSGFSSFVRRLRGQPGVQLNPILQAVEADFGGDADQVVALAARLTRGRIDRAFLVNAANLERMTGAAEPMRVNALNEARLQISEALKNGSASVLVSRLVPAAAEKRYVGVTIGGGGGGGGGFTYLLLDEFTGSGSVYDRQVDTVNLFSPDMKWYEQHTGGYVQDGCLLHDGDPYGYPGVVQLRFDEYTTVTDYFYVNGAQQSVDLQVDAFEIHIRATRLSGSGSCYVIFINPATGGIDETHSATLSETTGVFVDSVIAIPAMSSVRRIGIEIHPGVAVDYFAIVKPS